ncbi:MAG: hypothetical protein WBP56_23460 [Polyangia bacterium]
MRAGMPAWLSDRCGGGALAVLVSIASVLAARVTVAQETPTPESPPGERAPVATAPLAESPQPKSPKPVLPVAATPVEPMPPPFTWRSTAIFAGGAVTALAAHESCHLLANLATGNRPSFEPVTFLGFIPYFAIVPSIRCRGGDCTKSNGEHYWAGRPGLYTIVSAGIQCQHYEDEVMLTWRPGLRTDDAPFRKGMLALNTLLSIGYVLANWTGVEPTDGDIRGISRDGGAPRLLLSSMIFGIAVVDIARYYYPRVRWLAWLNRVAKVSVTGIAFAM